MFEKNAKHRRNRRTLKIDNDIICKCREQSHHVAYYYIDEKILYRNACLGISPSTENDSENIIATREHSRDVYGT